MTAIALTIAGSDSGGGAGIQADLKAFSALGVYGASVITALTAQNTRGVTGIHDVPPDFVTAQIDAVFSDIAVDAVKIGMLSRPETIRAVADGLRRWKPSHVVLDPVMVATSGDMLLVPEARDSLVSELFPLATLITPNMSEAAVLTGMPVAASEDEMLQQADALQALGARNVLLKGGHGQGAEAVDVLLHQGGRARFTARRHATLNTHGTGCTLSSAIAAGLALGLGLEGAVRAAKDYLTGAIVAADDLRIGGGHGPVHHFHALWSAKRMA
jgi:hydroxymethylpyrimidine/phosphomethylpyrimidine kinase